MTKLYFDNDLETPSGLIGEERVLWHYRMVGGLAAHVPHEIWQAVRQRCVNALLEQRKERGPELFRVETERTVQQIPSPKWDGRNREALNAHN